MADAGRVRTGRVEMSARTSSDKDSEALSVTPSGKKLSSRWFRLVHSLLMSTAMVFAMTLIITTVNIGLVEDFFQRWLRAFGIAYVFALPLTYLLTSTTRRLTARFVEPGD